MGLATPDLCVPPQYTTKLKQDLQNVKLNSQNLDVLSPDARQDLKALHDSGIEKIQYPRFHDQVSGLGASPFSCSHLPIPHFLCLCVDCLLGEGVLDSGPLICPAAAPVDLTQVRSCGRCSWS